MRETPFPRSSFPAYQVGSRRAVSVLPMPDSRPFPRQLAKRIAQPVPKGLLIWQGLPARICKLRFSNGLRLFRRHAVKLCGQQSAAVRITRSKKVLQPTQFAADFLKSRANRVAVLFARPVQLAAQVVHCLLQ